MDFQVDVIDQSHNKPVLVDFWAPWCGPCRVLGPVIEGLATEQKDRWSLVKLNTEEHQELAVQFGIKGIPNVKMFYKGEVVAEFAGALPKNQIESWLDEHIPSKEKESWSEIVERLTELQSEDQIPLVESFLKVTPKHHEAQVSLAKLICFTDLDRAILLVEDIKQGEEDHEVKEDLTSLKEWFEVESSEEGSTDQMLSLASSRVRDKDHNSAAELVIKAVTQDKNHRDDLPRRAAIALFRLLGPTAETTRKYRRLFDMALY